VPQRSVREANATYLRAIVSTNGAFCWQGYEDLFFEEAKEAGLGVEILFKDTATLKVHQLCTSYLDCLADTCDGMISIGWLCACNSTSGAAADWLRHAPLRCGEHFCQRQWSWRACRRWFQRDTIGTVPLPTTRLRIRFSFLFPFLASGLCFSKACTGTRAHGRADTAPGVLRLCVHLHALLQLIESNDLDARIDLQRRCKTAREHDSTWTEPVDVPGGLFL
jgi:hypothetical protein